MIAVASLRTFGIDRRVENDCHQKLDSSLEGKMRILAILRRAVSDIRRKT
jgi:hypothetical protein